MSAFIAGLKVEYMNINIRTDFCYSELDPKILSIPFGVQTNWHAIIGGPCSGKSTLLNLLNKQGYKTIPERARLYIEEIIARGKSCHPILEDGERLQQKILELQITVESELIPEEFLFLDGAVPASLAWFRVFGLNPNKMLADCFLHRYASIFLLDLLPFKSDVGRIDEMSLIRNFLDECQMLDFNALGYNVIRVPILPPEERVSFVLENLASKKYT
jgi:predicted ATPase